MKIDEMMMPPGLQLSWGGHETYGDGMCALELADYLDRRRRGQPVFLTDESTDRPACVCPTIAAFGRTWNDDLRSERTRILVPLVPMMLDTRGSVNLSKRRAWMAADWLLRSLLPAWLPLAGLEGYAARLRALPEVRSVSTLGEAKAMIAAVAELRFMLCSPPSISGPVGRLAMIARATGWTAAETAGRRLFSSQVEELQIVSKRIEFTYAARRSSQQAIDSVVEQLQQGAAGLLRRMCELKEEHE